VSARVAPLLAAALAGLLVAVAVTWATGRAHVAEALVATQSGQPRDEWQSQMLAKQYARLVPDDVRVLAPAARATGFSMGEVSRRLALSQRDELPLIELRFRAPDARRALAGARAAVTAMTRPGGSAPGAALVEEVRERPRGALGRFLGVALGAIVALALALGLQRHRPRLLHAASLRAVFDGPIVALPAAQLGPALRAGAGDASPVVVAPEARMRRELTRGRAAERDPAVAVHADLPDAGPEVGIVVVVRHGCRLDDALAALRRLGDLGARPARVLVVGGRRHEVVAPEGAR